MKKLFTYFSLFCIFANPIYSLELTEEIITTGLQSQLEKLPLIHFPGVKKTVDFEVNLTESSILVKDQFTFSGFRFKTPTKIKKTDFIWYFNTPANWGHWYILPTSGKNKPAFKNWLTADKIYESFDTPNSAKRLRCL